MTGMRIHRLTTVLQSVRLSHVPGGLSTDVFIQYPPNVLEHEARLQYQHQELLIMSTALR